jgi:hypothetical protein
LLRIKSAVRCVCYMWFTECVWMNGYDLRCENKGRKGKENNKVLYCVV